MIIRTSKEISVKGIFTLILLVYALLFFSLTPIVLNVENQFVDGLTIILNLIMILFFIIVIQHKSKSFFDIMATIVTIFSIYFFPRVISYIIIPQFVEFPFGKNMTSDLINEGLFKVYFGSIVLILGIKLSDIISRSTFRASIEIEKKKIVFSSKILMTVFFIALGINFYFTNILQLSPYGKMQADNYNTLIQLIKVCIEFDSVFKLVFAGILFNLLMKNKLSFKYLIIVGVLYVGYTAVSGSRVGVLRLIWSIIITIVVINQYYRFKVKKISIMLLVLGVFAFAIFPVATKLRHSITTSHHKDLVLQEDVTFDIVKDAIGPAINRLGCLLDYPILITTHKGNKNAKLKYMNFEYPIKNIVNLIMPGNPYPEAMVSTSRVVDVIYRGGVEQRMYEYYFSEFWTIWGLTYVMFGGLTMYIVIFLFGIILNISYIFIFRIFSGNTKFLFRIWFLFYVLYGSLLNMGFDDGFITAFQGLIQFFTLIVMLKVLVFTNNIYKDFKLKLVAPKYANVEV